MSPFSPMIRTLASVVCAVALGWLHLAAMAAETNRIEAINVAGQQGGQVLVKITMSQPLANPPAGFSVNNPPRIALDFPNTVNGLGRNSQDVKEGDLRSLNIVQALVTDHLWSPLWNLGISPLLLTPAWSFFGA